MGFILELLRVDSSFFKRIIGTVLAEIPALKSFSVDRSMVCGGDVLHLVKMMRDCPKTGSLVDTLWTKFFSQDAGFLTEEDVRGRPARRRRHWRLNC